MKLNVVLLPLIVLWTSTHVLSMEDGEKKVAGSRDQKEVKQELKEQKETKQSTWHLTDQVFQKTHTPLRRVRSCSTITNENKKPTAQNNAFDPFLAAHPSIFVAGPNLFIDNSGRSCIKIDEHELKTLGIIPGSPQWKAFSHEREKKSKIAFGHLLSKEIEAQKTYITQEKKRLESLEKRHLLFQQAATQLDADLSHGPHAQHPVQEYWRRGFDMITDLINDVLTRPK